VNIIILIYKLSILIVHLIRLKRIKPIIWS